MPQVSSSACAMSADAAAAAATAAAAGTGIHTELCEACGVAVLQLYVVPGQAAVSDGVLASALDDVAAAVAAVCHDEGLQLVRWGALRWLLLAQLEPGELGECDGSLVGCRLARHMALCKAPPLTTMTVHVAWSQIVLRVCSWRCHAHGWLRV
jgi:hypothetical protein